MKNKVGSIYLRYYLGYDDSLTHLKYYDGLSSREAFCGNYLELTKASGWDVLSLRPIKDAILNDIIYIAAHDDAISCPYRL